MTTLTDYDKYLKYKLKYISLKKSIDMKGGGKTELMLFKADWCGFCKRFTPVWNTLKNMDQYKNKFEFTMYDEKKNKKENEEHKIQGYPTLLVKNNNNIEEYSGPKEMEHMIEFLDNLN